MAISQNVKFFFTRDLSKYTSLASKDPLALYFIEDPINGNYLYKGETLIAAGSVATSMADGLMSKEDKIALDELAESKGLEFDELLDEVEAIVYSGTKINIDYFLDEVMDEDHLDDIFEYFKESESDDLELAINELGGDYTEEEIRLVRIKFISEMGN